MHDLNTLQRMNSAIENAKARKLAKATNSLGGESPKDAEKGRPAQVRKATDKAIARSERASKYLFLRSR
jgi:hypothetical protein